MHCSDLERYLEACLDGQLGDSRRRALKDHLVICGSCRERIDSLRRFEAELQRRLRSMQHETSLWQPLGLETVSSTAPVPRVEPVVLPPSPAAPATGGATGARRGHRLRLAPTHGTAPVTRPAVGTGFGRRVQGLAGVALIVAAVGAVADLALSGLGWLGADRRAAIYRAYVEGEVDLELRTAEPARLSLWLGEQLGGPVSLPEAPGGFTLIGGSTGEAVGQGSAVEGGALAVYATAYGPALLMIEALADPDLGQGVDSGTGTLLEQTVNLEAPGDAAPLADALAAAGGNAGAVVFEDGLSRLDWQDGRHAYSLIGALPPDKLALFAP